MSTRDGVGDLLRELAPQVLGALVRRHGDFARCEDAVADALVEAHTTWSERGIPEHPRGWLRTVATRRLVDGLRADASRERREAAVSQETRLFAGDTASSNDDTLALLILCAHPALTPATQLALMLRAVGGLSTAEIGRALLVPDATVAQRISRAKATIRTAGARFALPAGDELRGRLAVVHQVLYIIFTEGWAASGGEDLLRPDLSTEAIRLSRLLHAHLPSSSETAGLLALMLLHDSRRAARTDAAGALVPLDEQDRSRWDADAAAEGIALLTDALTSGTAGPYQVQAAIAAVHAEATDPASTDWLQIVGLYDTLMRMAPDPVVSLNRAVAVGMAHGAAAGLALVETLEREGALAGHHRVDAVRAHLLERTGDPAAAAASYRAAARGATNGAEKRFLVLRATRLEGSTPR